MFFLSVSRKIRFVIWNSNYRFIESNIWSCSLVNTLLKYGLCLMKPIIFFFYLQSRLFVLSLVSKFLRFASHSDYDPLPWSAIALRHARFRAWCVFLSSINFTFTRRFRIVMPIEILEHLHVKTAIQHAKRLRVEYNAIRLLVKLFFFI